MENEKKRDKQFHITRNSKTPDFRTILMLYFGIIGARMSVSDKEQPVKIYQRFLFFAIPFDEFWSRNCH